MSSAPLPEQDLVFVRHGHSCANALKWAGDQRGGLSGAWSKITNHQRGALAADSWCDLLLGLLRVKVMLRVVLTAQQMWRHSRLLLRCAL